MLNIYSKLLLIVLYALSVQGLSPRDEAQLVLEPSSASLRHQQSLGEAHPASLHRFSASLEADTSAEGTADPAEPPPDSSGEPAQELSPLTVGISLTIRSMIVYTSGFLSGAALILGLWLWHSPLSLLTFAGGRLGIDVTSNYTALTGQDPAAAAAAAAAGAS